MSNKLEIISFTLLALFMLVVAERAVHNWTEVRVANSPV